MKELQDKTFDEERALYGEKDLFLYDCRFSGPADGESALKECENLTAKNCRFELRYPFWHVNSARIDGCVFTETCRAGFWYDENITVENSTLNGIKAFRECTGVTVKLCKANSPEFLWKCRSVRLEDFVLTSEYPFFECKDMVISGLELHGKYSFQYVENVEIKNSVLDTKDAFWHAKNVVVKDSIVKGEYLGWYSENVKFVRCKIIGTQPLCYAKKLVLEDCTTENCDLAFEKSEVNATVVSEIDSVKNPKSGKIVANGIKELILEDGYFDKSAVEIIIKGEKV